MPVLQNQRSVVAADHYGCLFLTNEVSPREFKRVEREPAGAALAQLKAKRYADKYRGRRQELFLDALKELFDGNESLFARPEINARWDWSVRIRSCGSGSTLSR